MIIVLKKDATKKDIDHVIKKIEKAGLKAHPSIGEERTVIGAIGDERVLRIDQIKAIKAVEKVTSILKPYKLASREFKKEDTIIKIGDVEIGGNQVAVMAGPCAVESKEQIIDTAISIKKNGANFLRGGAFKPRTGPYSFQGLGEEGLKYMAEARDKTGLLIVTEVMDPRDVKLVAKYSDILQIGTRNMQNYPLLKEVGKVNKPVLLKRGLSATMKEFLLAAEYIMVGGNHQVILCERGIRTFITDTRNTLDLSIIPLVKEESHLPIVIDPSHGTGKRRLVSSMSKAAIAAGADGLMIEVHPNPEDAISDGDQSVDLEQFSTMMDELKPITEAIGRKI